MKGKGVKPEYGSMAAFKTVDAHTLAWARDGYPCHLDLLEEASGTNGHEHDHTVSLNRKCIQLRRLSATAALEFPHDQR